MEKTFNSTHEAIQYLANEICTVKAALQVLVHALDHAGVVDRAAFADGVTGLVDKTLPSLSEHVAELCKGIMDDGVPTLSVIDGGKSDPA